MHVPSHPLSMGRRKRLFAACAASVFASLLASCASPGPPRPPSLHLPEVVTDLTAERVGGEVHLHWTSPAHTTDGFNVPSPMTAEICRDPHPKTESVKAAPKGSRASAAQNAPGCEVVARLDVKPGVTDAKDPLPAGLAAEPAALLGYRIRILNPQGRSAGISRAALVPAGEAPPPVEGLRAAATRSGAMIEWQRLDSPSQIELDRTLLSVPAVKASKKSASVALPDDQPVDVRLRSAKDDMPAKDPGGTLDRTAVRGQRYLYRAQRIRTVELSGNKFELRGQVSSPVTLEMTDRFAPAAPTGLAAVPSTDGSVAGIDLSWQANTEADVAGYNVYRREGSSGFERLTAKPVLGPAFSDTKAISGSTYIYRVTAVDVSGNESSPSSEVTETVKAH
jgi:hypothetical protein